MQAENLSPADLAELRQLAAAATAGPWAWSDLRPGAQPADKDLQGSLGGFVAYDGSVVMHFGADYTYYPMEGQPPTEADRRFIAAANPAAILALLDMLPAAATGRAAASAAEAAL